MLGESTNFDRGMSEFDLQFLVFTAKSGVVSAVYGNKAPASQQLKYAPPVWRICFPRYHNIYKGVFKHLLAHLDSIDPQACDNLCEGWSELALGCKARKVEGCCSDAQDGGAAFRFA